MSHQGIFNGQGLQSLVDIHRNADTTSTRFGENGEIMAANRVAPEQDLTMQSTFGFGGPVV